MLGATRRSCARGLSRVFHYQQQQQHQDCSYSTWVFCGQQTPLRSFPFLPKLFNFKTPYYSTNAPAQVFTALIYNSQLFLNASSPTS